MQTNQPEPVYFGIMVLPGKIASALPLEQTRVNAHFTGLISTVTVVQSFDNPFEIPIELEYLFPLPENAALIDFSIKIGPRIIHAELKEVEQAKQAYEQARQAGRQSSILEQRRPNLFAIQLANVLPSHPIEVSIVYENQLSINPDEVEFVFPMGLTPKYHSSQQPEESRGVDAPVALPGEKIGTVEIAITALLGQKTGNPTSPSHQLTVERLGDGEFSISLHGQYVPDHDFVLRFPLIEQTVEPAIWCTQDDQSEIALINWLPGTNENLDASIQSRELIFVLDRSGSMSGEPIRQARNALRACLRMLEPKDAFRILLFDDRLDWYRSETTLVSQDEIDQADRFLNKIEGRGGTEIVQAIEAALNLSIDRERVRYILFLTDGAVSAEERALQSIRQKLKQARIFTFGIGPSVNRALLTQMARLGRGTAEFLQLGEDIEETILRFQDKIAFPILTDIQLKWDNCQVWDLIPAVLPDLYAGQSLQIVTRLKREPSNQASRLQVTGRQGQEKVAIHIEMPGSDTDMPEVKRAWARARIDELFEQSASGQPLSHKIRQEIIGLALEHRLVTPYTAFLALDPEVVNPQGEMLSIAIAQPLPERLDWSGFVPPAPVQMAQTSFAVPAAPSNMMNMKRAFKDRSAREFADIDRAYPQNVSPSANLIPAPSDREFSTGSGLRHIQPDITETEAEKTPDTLRWLARTQNLNGSWSEDVEFTAAALLAFVRQGNTTRRGFYRKQVSRAAEWLLQADCEGSQAFFRAFALHSLASADPKLALITRIQATISQLPPAKTALELAIQTHLIHPNAAITGPQGITDLESLQIACVLNLELEVPTELLSNDPRYLVRVWKAGLTHKK